jgi:spermidine synthase
VGGLGTPLLFLLAGRPSLFRAALYLGVLACGCLVGLEIPLLLRVLALRQSFRTVIARVLAYDHAGSLAGSLLFAFVLMPLLGPLRGALVCGALNALVALYTTRVLRPSLSDSATRGLRVTAAAILAVLAYTALRAHSIIDAVDTARA